MQTQKRPARVYCSSLKPFEYFAPGSVSEALGILARFKGKARLVAGGTGLVVEMRARERAPEALVSLRCVKELGHAPALKGARIVISPTTTLSRVAASELLREKAPLLVAAALSIGTCQVRNRATIGGSVCRGRGRPPDIAPALIALGAALRVKDRRGERLVPAGDFFGDAGDPVRRGEAMIVQLQLAPQEEDERSCFRKQTACPGTDRGVASVAVRATLSRGVIARATVAAGGTSFTPARMKRAGETIEGSRGEMETLFKAAEVLADEVCAAGATRPAAGLARELLAACFIRAVKEVLA